MTLRALISFDQVVLTALGGITPQQTYGTNVLQTTYGVPGTVMFGSAALANAAGVSVGTNWFQIGPITNANYCTGWIISFADLNLFQSGATKAWIGFRTYASGAGNGASNVVGLSATPAAQTNTAVNVITPLLTEAQLARTTFSVAGAQYVEMLLDMVALTATIYVNGVQTQVSTFAAGMQYIAFSGTTFFSASYYQAFRDLYFLEVDSTLPNSRLGPITSTPLSPNSPGSTPNYSSYMGSITGSAVISATNSRFGGNSLFPGATTTSTASFPDNASVRIGATGDYTLECWVNPSNLTQNSVIFAKDTSGTTYTHLSFVAGNWNVFFDSASSTPLINVASGMQVNTWYHVALVRYQGVWTLYQNGVALATYATAGTYGNNTYPVTIGNWGGLNAPWQGYIDEFRMSNVARYTAPFTAPVSAFSADANTLLLCHFDSASGSLIADSGGNQPSAFQTIYGSSVAMSPFLQNVASNDPITLNYSSSAPAAQKIIAMQYKVAAQVQMAMKLGAKLVEGAQSVTLPGALIQDINPGYSRDLGGIQTVAPDGNAWTATSIGATNLVMTPTTLT